MPQFLTGQPLEVRTTCDILINGWEDSPRRVKVDTVLEVYHGDGEEKGEAGQIWVKLPDWYRQPKDLKKPPVNRGGDYTQLAPDQYEVLKYG